MFLSNNLVVQLQHPCIPNANVFLKRAVGANEVFMMTVAHKEGGVDTHQKKSDGDGKIMDKWAGCDAFRCLGVREEQLLKLFTTFSD